MYKRAQVANVTGPGYNTVAQMIPHDNEREESREQNGERLFLQISRAANRNLIGKTISCTTIDASGHGIKFTTDEFVPVGCLVDLWVDDYSRPGKFFLSGDIRWTQKTDKNKTLVGVRLLDGIATDIEQWRANHPDVTAS